MQWYRRTRFNSPRLFCVHVSSHRSFSLYLSLHLKWYQNRFHRFFFALPFLLLLVRWQLLLCVDGSKSVLSSSHNWDTRNLWICLLREKFIANYTQQLPGNLSFTEQLRKSSECKCVSVCAYVCEHAVCPCIYFNVYKYEIRFCRMRLLRLSFIVVKVLFANGI